MKTLTSPDRIKQDCRSINQTLLKLSGPRFIMRAVVLVVAFVVWLFVSSRLLAFGRTLDYSAFAAMGQQAVDLMVRINPYLWWVVVAIWTLIVFFGVRSWLNGSIAAGRATPVAADVLADLVAGLSEGVVDVMQWVWNPRDEPLTIGDLRRTVQETRHGRIEKIELVREQEAVLRDEARPAAALRRTASGAPAVGIPAADRGVRAARPAVAPPVDPTGRQDQEPTLGGKPRSVSAGRAEPGITR